MSTLLPKETIQVMRQFNDLGVSLYGIDCTLYIPNNLTTLEPVDMYANPDMITYTEYRNQKVWLQWYDKEVIKLRKSNALAEGTLPITARFKMDPEVITSSYIVLPTEYKDNQYKVLEFECINVIMQNTYDAEIYLKFSMAPRRMKGNQ